ncbi:hypothetical protein NEIFL0001_0942 [Neisseria flavescens SK114]|nr:hypothetical protein NEIFL0001_0942 [Neisseria flavescens SK114]
MFQTALYPCRLKTKNRQDILPVFLFVMIKIYILTDHE